MSNVHVVPTRFGMQTMREEEIEGGRDDPSGMRKNRPSCFGYATHALVLWFWKKEDRVDDKLFHRDTTTHSTKCKCILQREFFLRKGSFVRKNTHACLSANQVFGIWRCVTSSGVRISEFCLTFPSSRRLAVSSLGEIAWCAVPHFHSWPQKNQS